MDVNGWIGVGMGLGVGVVMLAVIAIVNAAFQDTQVTGVAGCNTTNTTGCGVAFNITGNGQTFLSNFTGQFGTIGTVAGVLLLFGLVIASGLGGYYLYNKVR